MRGDNRTLENTNFGFGLREPCVEIFGQLPSCKVAISKDHKNVCHTCHSSTVKDRDLQWKPNIIGSYIILIPTDLCHFFQSISKWLRSWNRDTFKMAKTSDLNALIDTLKFMTISYKFVMKDHCNTPEWIKWPFGSNNNIINKSWSSMQNHFKTKGCSRDFVMRGIYSWFCWRVLWDHRF